MSKNRKVIITCAVTGAIHTPSMSPHLPITADEIVEAAVGAAEARAAALRRPGRRDDGPFRGRIHIVRPPVHIVIHPPTPAPVRGSDRRAVHNP